MKCHTYFPDREEFEEKVELSPASGEEGWLSLARSGLVAGATRVGVEGEMEKPA